MCTGVDGARDGSGLSVRAEAHVLDAARGDEFVRHFAQSVHHQVQLRQTDRGGERGCEL